MPRKNIVDLCGKPLIAYSIEVALRVSLISRVVVSTDDVEIAEVAKKYGAEVPFLRPAALAGDKSPLGEAVTYTVNKLGGQYPHVIITLLPTQPFRSLKLINYLVGQTLKNYGQVETVSKTTVHESSHLLVDDNLTPTPIWKSFFHPEGIQKRELFRFNGVFSANIPLQNQNRKFVHTIADPIAQIDIDTPEDLALAKNVLRKMLFKFY